MADFSLSFLQEGSVSEKDFIGGDSSNKKPAEFPGTRDEEVGRLFSKVREQVELRCDWLICEGLLDAIMAIIMECEQLSSSPKLMMENRRRVVDVTYFDDQVLPKISTSTEDIRKYLMHLCSGVIDIENKQPSNFIQSVYHAQRLVFLKLEKLFFQEKTEDEELFLQTTFRRIQLRLFLHDLHTSSVISSDDYSLIYSYFLCDWKTIDREDREQMRQIEQTLTSILDSSIAKYYRCFLMESLLVEHAFKPETVAFLQKLLVNILENWALSGKNELVLEFVASLKEPVSSKLDLSSFFANYLRQNFSSGVKEASQLYQSVLCDQSKSLANQLQNVVEHLQRHRISPPSIEGQQRVHTILSICQLSDPESMWAVMHRLALAANKHFTHLVLDVMLTLLRENMFYELKSLLERASFSDLKLVLILLGWASLSGLSTCISLLTCLGLYPPKQERNEQQRGSRRATRWWDNFQHPSLEMRVECISNQLHLVDWCLPFRSESVDYPEFSSAKLQRCSPLYLIHSSCDVNRIAATEIVAKISQPILYRSKDADGDIKRDVETYRSFLALKVACNFLVQTTVLVSRRHMQVNDLETRAGRVFSEISNLVRKMECPEKSLELLENLFSLLFVRVGNVETVAVDARDKFQTCEMPLLHETKGAQPDFSGSGAEVDQSMEGSFMMVAEDSETAMGGRPILRPTGLLKSVKESSFESQSGEVEGNALLEKENDLFVANTLFVFKMLQLLRQSVRDLAAAAKVAPHSFSPIGGRLDQLELALEEAAMRLQIVSTLDVDEKYPANAGKDPESFLCIHPEKTNMQDISVSSEFRVSQQTVSSVEHMMSDPTSLLFKVMWRRDFDLAENILERYHVTCAEVIDMVRCEKMYFELWKKVSDFGDREFQTEGRRQRQGAFTFQDDEADSTSILDRISRQASAGIESMTIPQILEQFFQSYSIPNFSSFLSAEKQAIYKNFTFSQEFSRLLIQLDLACSCPLPISTLRNIVDENFDHVSASLNMNEPRRDLGELGGVQYAIVALKNLLETDVCEQENLLKVLANSTMPITAASYTQMVGMLSSQKRSRRELLVQLDGVRKKIMEEARQSAVTSHQLTSSQASVSTKKSTKQKLVKQDSMASIASLKEPKAERENAMRDQLHKAMKDVLNAFKNPDITVSRLYETCSKGEIVFEQKVPSRVVFLPVFYEYLKQFVDNLLKIDSQCSTLENAWKLRCDDVLISVQKLAVCPFLVLNHRPTELICDLVFDKQVQLSLIEKGLCERANIDLSDIICNRLSVSLPWRCLTLTYNPESVMSCAYRPLNCSALENPQTDSDAVSHISSLASSDTASVVGSKRQKKMHPNEFLENILTKLVLFFDDSANNSGIMKGEVLLQVCDSYDLDAILEQTSGLESLDLDDVGSNRHWFAFLCNLYNLMLIHGAVTEAKAFKSGKDNMGLTFLVGGSALEHLAFQLRLTYSVGNLRNVNLWQVRNCLLRNKKSPTGFFSYGKRLHDLLQSVSNPRLRKMGDFSKFDETFLLIDCSAYSPVLQVLKPETIEEQISESKQHWVESFVRVSNSGVSVPVLLHEYLFETHRSEFLENHFKDYSLSGNSGILVTFLSDYLEERLMKKMMEMKLRSGLVVNVHNSREHSRKFQIQYDFNTVADFMNFGADSDEAKKESIFVDGLNLCEKNDRNLCKTYPINREIKDFLFSKNPLHATLIDMLHHVNDICTESARPPSEDSPGRRERSSSFRKATFLPSTQTVRSSHSEHLNQIRNIAALKLDKDYKACRIWVRQILKPFEEFYHSESAQQPLTNSAYLGVLSEHTLVSGAKCPKVVKRYFVFIEQILKSDDSLEVVCANIELLTKFLLQEPVNELRFQPLFDLLTCLHSLADPNKVSQVKNPTTRALFLLDKLKNFSIPAALGYLNLANRDKDLENQRIKDALAKKTQDVVLYQKVLQYFPLSEESESPANQWKHVELKLAEASKKDIVYYLCGKASNFKTAKKWCDYNANVSSETREEVDLLSMQNLVGNGQIYKFLAFLLTFECAEKRFETAQELLTSCDATAALCLVAFLLDKHLTNDSADWIMSANQVDVLRNQYLSLIMVNELSPDIQEKYLHLVRSPKLVIHQLFCNNELAALKKVYTALTSIYTLPNNLEETALLSPSFLKRVTLTSLQDVIFHYAKLIVKTDNYLFARNQLNQKKNDGKDDVDSLDTKSLVGSVGTEDNVSVLDWETTETSDSVSATNAKESLNCYICNSAFGYILQRRNRCRGCKRFACSRCGAVLTVSGVAVWICENCQRKRAQKSAVEKGESVKHLQFDSALFEDDKEQQKQAFWKLPKEAEDASDVLAEFFYMNAPNLAILDAILELHVDGAEVVNFLCQQVKHVSRVLADTVNRNRYRVQSGRGRVAPFEEHVLTTLMKQLLQRATDRLKQMAQMVTTELGRSSSILDLSRRKSSLTPASLTLTGLTFAEMDREVNELKCALDVMLILISINFDPIPDLLTPKNWSDIVTKLVYQGKFQVALEICQKSGLDPRIVHKKWGFNALTNGSLQEARNCFKKCLELKPSAKNEELVNEIVGSIETSFSQPPPYTFNSFNDYFELMADELCSEKPVMMGKLEEREECVYYMQNFLPPRSLVTFYAHRRELQRAVEVFSREQLLTVENFGSFFTIVVELGESEGKQLFVEELLREMKLKETPVRSWRKFLLPISSSNSLYSNRVLYLVHLYLQDFVRAMEDCVEIYRDLDAVNYRELRDKEGEILEKYKDCLSKAISHCKVNYKLEGNKYLTLNELNECVVKLNIQRELSDFLQDKGEVRFPRVKWVTTEEANSKTLPKLLCGYLPSLRICCALLIEYQTGAGFNMAVKILKCFQLKFEDVCRIVAEELHAKGSFRSMIYLASSFLEVADSDLTRLVDCFLYQCVHAHLNTLSGKEIDDSTAANLKQLIEKISSLDVQIDCYIVMRDLRQAYLSIVKKNKAGVNQMEKLKRLAENGDYGDQTTLISICNSWLNKFKIHSQPSAG